jgi:hypothetical protein
MLTNTTNGYTPWRTNSWSPLKSRGRESMTAMRLEGVFTIYIYGPSAERLFSAARPILKEFRPPASYLIKRYGKPGSKEDRVALDGDDAPPAQTAMPRFSELSHEDRKRLDQQTAIVAVAAEQPYGASSLRKTVTDLPVLQRLIDDNGVQQVADLRVTECRHRLRGCYGERTPVTMGDGDR